jgi:hypothetical protein
VNQLGEVEQPEESARASQRHLVIQMLGFQITLPACFGATSLSSSMRFAAISSVMNVTP